MPTIYGLIPARAGSQRIKDKNIQDLNGKPLFWWTVKAAVDSGIFKKVIVSSDIDEMEIFCNSTRHIYFDHRKPEHATSNSPDIDWIRDYFENRTEHPDYFMILRPTNPFRTAQTIIRAWEQIKQDEYADSLRAVSKVKQHPGKMWTVQDNKLIPLMNWPEIEGQPSYNLPTQLLPEVYVQNACIEIGEVRNALFRGTVSGEKIIPFYTHGLEGFDINTQEDLLLARYYVEKGIVKL
jgi:CMP-N,N'-diacetyllegionaminic acid synthase